jgi:hypothetical protein
MIDWDAPIYAAETGVQVYVHSLEGDNGDIVVVQNRHGYKLRFDWVGNPIDHLHRLTNDGMHQHPVRTRLAQLIHLRALQLLGFDEVAMEEHNAWGMF